ncbi:MAG: TonB-dependent receptor [Acidobacteriota bacterium]
MKEKITAPRVPHFCKFQYRLFFVLLLLIHSINPIALASEPTGRLEGVVNDQSGATLAEVSVKLRDASGVVAYQTKTNNDGRFSMVVSEGKYYLYVEAKGFSQPDKPLIEIVGGEKKTIQVELKVAALDENIVVTATRTPTPADELTGSTAVINANDFERKHNSQISEALRLVPGLTVAQSGGRGAITSIFIRGGESDYNKVLIDGVPVNAAGGLYDFAFLTPENLERVEVVRGPRSALFGSDAMTGVIQLITRRGSTTTPEVELSGEGGNLNYHRENFLVSGLTRWFDYTSSLAYQNTDGQFRNADFINRSASVNLGFKLNPQADLRILSRVNNTTLGVPNAVGRLFADPDQRQKHHDIALSGALDYRTTSRWYQTARFIFSEFETHSFDPKAQDLFQPDTPPFPPGSFGNDFAFSFRDHQKRLGFQYQTIAALSSTNVLTAGLDVEHEAAVFTDDFSRVSPTRNNLGLYVQDQLSLLERLFITAGVRLERNSGDVPKDLQEALSGLGNSAPVEDVGFGVKANPKVALSFLMRRQQDGVWGATRLKGSFGTGIKEPSLVEAFSPSIFFLGNPDLKPERAVSFDAGIVQEFFNRRASLEASYFDNRFRDQIVFVFDPLTFGAIQLPNGRLTNFVNQDRASARGLELISALRPALKLQIAASYTYLRSRLEKSATAMNEVGLALLRRPKHSGAFEINWIGNRFDLSFDGAIVGKRRDLDPISGARFLASGLPIFNDGYVKLNLAGSYKINNRLTAFLRIENLLNQKYEEILGYPANKLNFRAGMRLRIGGGK